MTARFTRRQLMGALLPGVALAATRPARAEEDVLNQTNEGAGTYWLPIVTNFYARPDQGTPTFPEDDGPPVFPDGIINPALHFALNPSPIDTAPTIDTDWAVLQKRYQGDEQASAWALARQFGKPRLWVHRAFDDNYLAGYPELHRVFVVFELDVVRERFPIAAQLAPAARKQLIRDNVRIVAGGMKILVMNGVRKNGSGGTAEETPLAITDLSNRTLSAQADLGITEFIPRFETIEKGDLLDRVIAVAVELELEAGTALGLAEPERKKLKTEIRFAVGKQYVEIGKLSGDSKRK